MSVSVWQSITNGVIMWVCEGVWLRVSVSDRLDMFVSLAKDHWTVPIHQLHDLRKKPVLTNLCIPKRDSLLYEIRSPSFLMSQLRNFYDAPAAHLTQLIDQLHLNDLHHRSPSKRNPDATSQSYQTHLSILFFNSSSSTQFLPFTPSYSLRILWISLPVHTNHWHPERLFSPQPRYNTHHTQN